MGRMPFEPKYLRIAVYTLGVIVIALIFSKAMDSLDVIWAAAVGIKNVLMTALAPFLYGFFIAYFLNAPLSAIERFMYWVTGIFTTKRPNAKVYRTLSVITTYVLFIMCVVWLVRYLVPELTASVMKLVETTESYIDYLNKQQYTLPNSSAINEYINYFNGLFNTNYTLNGLLNMTIAPVISVVSQLPTVLQNIVLGTVNAATALLNTVLGFLISFYMVMEKENFSNTLSRWIKGLFRRATAAKILDIARTSHKTIQNFIIGKALDSLIIGIIYFVVCVIMGAPLPVLLSLIIGITNMIPYFGPFIGAVPVILIVLILNPSLALWTAIAIFLIQQFDGYILGPRILGSSTGLNALGVIFSILVGGALFGVAGMFFGVPIFAVLLNMLKTIMDKRYYERYAIEDARVVNTEEAETGDGS